jgi:1,2-phenylacetyl-CoA epoxidase PaaB subunit
MKDPATVQHAYNAPHLTPKELIAIFQGDDVKEIVQRNLVLACDNWLIKKQDLTTIEKVVREASEKELAEYSLAGIYKAMIPNFHQQVRRLEAHIKHLQRCFDLLHQSRLFQYRSQAGRHVDTVALKLRTDIVSVIGKYVELRQSGATFKAQCPFHNDRSPSFVVYPSDSRWWCFACNEGGDVITFIQKLRDCTFLKAARELEAL